MQSPQIILGVILILLLIAAVLWTSFKQDKELDRYLNRLKTIAYQAGYTEEINLQKGTHFHTFERSIIYMPKKCDYPDECILRSLIHELAHRFNKDSSEHGTMFQKLEKNFINTCEVLGFGISEKCKHECQTIKNNRNENSDEREIYKKLKYSFDTKTIKS